MVGNKVVRLSEVRPFGKYIKALAYEEDREDGLVVVGDSRSTQKFLVVETGQDVLDVEADDVIMTGATAGLELVDEVDGSKCWLIKESSVWAVL